MKKFTCVLIVINFVLNSNAQFGSGSSTNSIQPLTINGVYIGRGGPSGYSSNVAIGSGALATPSNNGNDNVAIGQNALSVSPNRYNTAIGYGAMQNHNGGTLDASLNVAIGRLALAMISSPMGGNSSCSGNIAIGALALGNSFSVGTGLTNVGNIAIGSNSLLNNTSNSNIALGNNALKTNANGEKNIALGSESMFYNISGSNNIGIGNASLRESNNIGTNNIGIGTSSLGNNKGSKNIAIGDLSLRYLNTDASNGNIGIGQNVLQNLTAGSNNIAIGNSADVINGQNNQLSIQNIIYGINNLGVGSTISTGSIGIGIIPTILTAGIYPTGSIAKLQVNGTLRIAPAGSGLLTSSSPVANYLYADAQGMIAQAPLPSTLSTNCSTANWLTMNGTAINTITCSQVFDNGSGSGVGIGTNTGFNYLSGSTFTQGTPAPPSFFRLVVNGWASATAYVALSDERLKKDITKIENPLSKISKLNGYTYLWNNDFKTTRRLDDSRQVGFLAQEVLQVLPEAVVKSSDDDILGLNYNAIIPLLAEGIKDQQKIIEKQQLTIQNIELQLIDLRNRINQISPKQLEININTLTIEPNPIIGISKVGYKLKSNSGFSKLIISDLNGKLIKLINLPNNSIEGHVLINKNNLLNGMYIFSLINNNEELQSKKVLVVD